MLRKPELASYSRDALDNREEKVPRKREPPAVVIVPYYSVSAESYDTVALGREFNAIVPMLWMAAGSIGNWEVWDGTSAWSLPASSTYGVLFSEEQITSFAAAIEARDRCTHVWLVTNSHSAFAEMRTVLADHLEVAQLYRDYLRTFAVISPAVSS